MGERRVEASEGALLPTHKKELETSKFGVLVRQTSYSGGTAEIPSKETICKAVAKKSGKQIEGPGISSEPGPRIPRGVCGPAQTSEPDDCWYVTPSLPPNEVTSGNVLQRERWEALSSMQTSFGTGPSSQPSAPHIFPQSTCFEGSGAGSWEMG